MSDKCRYTLIGDYGCYPRVAYKSECGFDLVVLEGYDIGTSGERLNTLRMPVKTCARCGKEIDIVDPRISLTLGPHDAIAYIRKRIGDGFAMEDFEAAQWLESRDAAQRQAGCEEEMKKSSTQQRIRLCELLQEQEELYAAVVEAARGKVEPCGAIYKCPVCETCSNKAICKALDELGKARRG